MPNYALSNTDLVSLVERHAGISLVKKSNHFQFGPEFCGPCPFPGCGGQDRFLVWPECDRPHYVCRRCGMTGSPAQFLVDYLGMSYFEANNELGFDEWDNMYEEAVAPTLHFDKEQPPSKKWQEAGMLLVERAERYLWHPKSPEGQKALAYLRARGLTDETIKRARLGYCPLGKDGRWWGSHPGEGQFDLWGIDPATVTDPKKRERGYLLIPDGILIPWFEGPVLWKIAFKRPFRSADDTFDYGQVLGSGEGLYNVDALQVDEPVMMVEGEFDCLSVQQEAGDLVNCVATGSTTRGKTGRWLGDLSLASFALQSFDDDEAGEDGSDYWLKALSHCIRWQPIFGKDPNEMLQKLDKESFRNWILWGLHTWENSQRLDALPEPSPLARVETGELQVVPLDYQRHITIQAEYDRLSRSERVMTPDGPGKIWDMKQLRVHIDRDMPDGRGPGAIRVVLDCLKGNSTGMTRLFPCAEISPMAQTALF